jgi:hypothetical protein
MLQRLNDNVRRGAVTAKTGVVYLLLWLVGVPGIILVLLFLFGVGR